jgi:acetyl-CoA hydrolase
VGALASLSKAGLLQVIPAHWSDLGRTLRVRKPAGVVAMIQVSPADERGIHSFGLSNDYVTELIGGARLVIAEVNELMPRTNGPGVATVDLDVIVPTARPLVTVRTPGVTQVHREIAKLAVQLVPDHAALQLGVGAVPGAVGNLLSNLRGLRVHSALVGDWLLALHQAGALSQEPGAIVLSSAAGTQPLYDYLSGPTADFRPVTEVSPPDVLARVPRLVAMNAALQVDLTGQVNAERAGGSYIGGLGGHADFMRGAQLSAGGCSVAMLPATAKDGQLSRIVLALEGSVVTTSRASTDFVVTEFGIADLRGRTLAERGRALIAIAAPEHRPALAAQMG